MMIDYRQWNQARRIQHGIDNGQLTEREASALKSGQQKIAGVVSEARADGCVDAGERAAIKQLQDQASRDIYQLKHNDERQPGAPKIPGSPTSPTDTRRVDARQARQADRIEAGLAKGDLTQHEARRLVAQQQGIHRFEAAALADGSLNNSERMQLERMQNDASMAIWLARHNGTRQGPATKPVNEHGQ